MSLARTTATGWVLRGLLLEKVVQHAVVTWAFSADAGGIRDAVAVDYRWLAAIGAAIGVSFAVALAGHLTGQGWSALLALALAVVDIVGEFIAQGTLSITVTLSFIVAGAIAVLSVCDLRRRRDSPV